MKVFEDLWNENPERLLKKAYDENFNWCISFVRKNNGTADDAADLFQDSISVAWIKLKEGKFQGDSEYFNAYLRQVCKYKWINQRRSFANNKIILAEDLSDFEEKIDHNSIEDDTAKLVLLENSFSSIGEKCRDLLSRFYFKKESLAILAKVMDTTEESMKTIKYRCMMRLRKAYLKQLKEDE